MTPTWKQLAETTDKLADAFPNTIVEKSCSKETLACLLILKDLGLSCLQKENNGRIWLASSQCMICMIIIKEFSGDVEQVRKVLPPMLPSYLLEAMCNLHKKGTKMDQSNLVKLVH